MIEFKSFGAFAVHLERLSLEGPFVTRHVLEEAAKIITKEAQEEIGNYQFQKGPFNEWAPLAESTLDDKSRYGYAPPDNPLLRTGEMRDSISYEISGDKAVVGSDSDIALYQELGTSRMPPRPFLGPAAYTSKLAIGVLSLKTVIAWVSGLGWKRPRVILTSADLTLK